MYHSSLAVGDPEGPLGTAQHPLAPNSSSATKQTLITVLHVCMSAGSSDDKTKNHNKHFHCFYKALVLFIGLFIRHYESEQVSSRNGHFKTCGNNQKLGSCF